MFLSFKKKQVTSITLLQNTELVLLIVDHIQYLAQEKVCGNNTFVR
jgi:hypothetical protein